MGKTEDKAREMLTQSHSRLMAAIDQVKAEAIKIQTLDELLGENTLAKALTDPFVKSLTPSIEPTPPELKMIERSKSKRKSVKRFVSEKKVKISEKIRVVLQKTPGLWMSVNEVNQAISKEYGEMLGRGSLQGALVDICHGEEKWLQSRKDGRLSKYTIVKNQLQNESSTQIE